jgi:predicted metal-dependent hydrolase
MKTKWGSCNPVARTIRLNTELAKKPKECLEYIVVHELAHLIERHHDERFLAIMDKHMPRWRLRRQELNAGPLAQEAWDH